MFKYASLLTVTQALRDMGYEPNAQDVQLINQLLASGYTDDQIVSQVQQLASQGAAQPGATQGIAAPAAPPVAAQPIGGGMMSTAEDIDYENLELLKVAVADELMERLADELQADPDQQTIEPEEDQVMNNVKAAVKQAIKARVVPEASSNADNYVADLVNKARQAVTQQPIPQQS